MMKCRFHIVCRWMSILALISALISLGACRPQPEPSGNFMELKALDQNVKAGRFLPIRWPDIPQRKQKASTGRVFLRATDSSSTAERETAILREIAAGNLPENMRFLTPVHLSERIDGRTVRAIIWAMPDYLAIGGEKDSIRMPMTPITAQKIADVFGLMLPTRKMVDAIYATSDLKLTPIPLAPTSAMSSNSYYRRHQNEIQKQLGTKAAKLIAGHKKDIVLSNVLRREKGKVAIYGWHRRSGVPIQPLSTVHDELYADYSHGVRLIAPFIIVDGVKMSISQVLRNPKLSRLISDEGPIYLSRI